MKINIALAAVATVSFINLFLHFLHILHLQPQFCLLTFRSWLQIYLGTYGTKGAGGKFFPFIVIFFF